MTGRTRLGALLLALACVGSPRGARAGFVIVNTDGPNEGFNDPTPAAPVGGNPGTTVGQQRLNVFVKAGQLWDALLQSPITIKVQASFDTLPCAPTSGVLGDAGPIVIDSDFSGAPKPATWFVGAEADRLAGTDLDPGNDDIVAQFNEIVGTPTCLSTRFWYYGFDGNEGANGIDLLPVLLHEFGHGLGYLTLTDETNGAYFAGLPTIWDSFLMDNVSNKHWVDMTAAERVASAINTNHLVWDGAAVTAWTTKTLGKRAHVVTSGALTGDFTSGQGVFYPALTTTGVTGSVVLVADGVGITTDGCETPFTNAGAIAGKIALMDRTSGCTMPQQALNAQNNGAIAAIIINNAAGPEPPLRGAAPTVSIPVASLSQTDGNALRTALGSGAVTATISLDPAHFAGVDSQNRALMFAPNPDQQGSSVSHWDVSAFPNLLMEPAINPDLSQNVDLTYENFFDIGWFPQLVDVPAGSKTAFAFTHAPNPTSEGGTLRFRLPSAARVELSLFDLAGRRIARLVNGQLEGGEHSIAWPRTDEHGHRVAAGIYLARLKAGAVERTLNVVLVD
ncbi:MAG TPA: PA domain-containing protein [Candidatus Eisenbacteria bacterium]